MSALIVDSPLMRKTPEQTAQSTDAEMQSKLNEVAFRVPVLRLDWFWKSLQSTYICHPNDYLYISNATPLDYSFVSPTRTSLDLLSPRASCSMLVCRPSDLLNIGEKENQDPYDTITEATEADESAFHSCLSPWPIDCKKSGKLS